MDASTCVFGRHVDASRWEPNTKWVDPNDRWGGPPYGNGCNHIICGCIQVVKDISGGSIHGRAMDPSIRLIWDCEQPVGKHYMATQYSSARASDGWHKDKASRGHDMGPTKGRKSPKRAGKGVLGRARIWAVSSQYSQEAWGARRKSKGQQGPRYGACGGRKIPKTSWTWMHPHCHDVTQVGPSMVSQVEGSTYGGCTHMSGLAPHFRPT
ncbi:hypothetical protein DFH09DRAFT_1079112 [Mycena vulgaris]|nr:hypothetical protein DFH09DRAFT_1079112 [Mycena vulgaris]